MGRACEFTSAILAALGSFCLGTCIGWGAQIQTQITKGQYGFTPSTNQNYWIGPIMNIGAALVCIPYGFLIQCIGRKLSMLSSVVPFVAGWACLVIGRHIAIVLLGRFLLGMAGGSFCVSAPVYTTEIAELKFRGMFGTFFQLLITLGILYAYITGAYVPTVQMHSLACGVAVVPLLIGLLFVPFSPTYLLSKGKDAKARSELAKVRPKGEDIDSELNNTKQYLAKLAVEKKPLCQTLCEKVNVKALFISIALMVGQQVGGINAFVFYSTSIFQSANSSLNPKVVTILLGIVMFVATFIQTFFIDLVGRKILLIFSASAQALACLVFGIYFFLLNGGYNVKSINWLPVVMLFLYIIGFSFGLGPIPWLMVGEIFAENIKAFAASIAGTVNWVLAFLVTVSFTPTTKAIGAAYCFWFFAVVNVLTILFVIFVLPETKNKSLEEIQKALGAKD